MGNHVGTLAVDLDDEREGAALHARVVSLFPICRSITGDGVRETLAALARDVPMERHEVPTGTPVLDWTVPDEWNVRGARIVGPDGRTVADFADSNLHLVSYSTPVDARMSLAELRPHLHSLPDRPHLVPYRTSYYTPSWGFCLRDDVLAALPEGEYDVRVDTTLAPGSLTYGECVVPGASDDEVLVSCHVCHPSLANDNLSGIAVAARLAQLLAGVDHRLTYRFVFVPGTIGSITWLARNEDVTGRVRHGVVLSGVGDPGPFSYKRSRRGDAAVDRAFAHVLHHSGHEHAVADFDPYGYDERQYCSPGFDLPVGRFSRSVHGRYPEYHTSGDDPSFVTPSALAASLRVVLEVLHVLEHDGTYRNLAPKGEPQLGRRGLYRSIGGGLDHRSVEMALLWVLAYSDGRATLLDVAERAGLPFRAVLDAAIALEGAGLLAPEAGA